MSTEHEWPYWSIDLPGLTRDQAQAILESAESTGVSFGGTLVDPSNFLTLHIDQSTVEGLHKLFLRAGTSDPKIFDDIDGIVGIFEIIDEWLGRP